MVKFCPRQESPFHPWTENGISECFLNTLSTTTLLFLTCIPCVCEIIFYKRYAYPYPVTQRGSNNLFRVQSLLHVLLSILILLQIIPDAFYSADVSISGVYIYKSIGGCLSWAIAFITLYFEASYRLPSIPSHGHGLILLMYWLFALILVNLPLASLHSNSWWWKLSSQRDIVMFTQWIIEYSLVLLIFLIGLKAPGLPNLEEYYRRLEDNSDQSVISDRSLNFAKKVERIKFFSEFIWPKNKILLRMRIVFCLILLVLGRITNLYMPIYYKMIVDSLTPSSLNGTFSQIHVRIDESSFYNMLIVFRWDLVLVWMVLRFFQGLGSVNAGFLTSLRNLIWIPVDQYANRELSIRIYRHLQYLSLNWHLSRKTGEMLRIIDRGTTSVSNIISYAVFYIGPTLFDIGIGIVFFSSNLSIEYGVIVLVTMILYFVATIIISNWRNRFRREMNVLENVTNAQAVDSLLNFETVKYYNGEEFEISRYYDNIQNQQSAAWKTTASLNLLNSSQNTIITFGTMVGTLVCVHDVVVGKLSVGDFVLFCTYVLQLYVPLNFLGTYYMQIQTNLVDMENMFELFSQKPDVVDVPDAKDLVLTNAKIEFRNVSFGYNPERKILKNVSFVVQPGELFAIVGETGSGKSTIMKLLFRFYDIAEGEILIDDQNISKVTQKSLRNAIGVVPQDTVLFNNDLLYNIKYGRTTASDEEAFEASRKADIHEKITTVFPGGYTTMVGERGLKLSGGEKQRVAIARTILKSPKIILLDEATSSLDTKTEKNIQKSLDDLATQKTTIVVAHRLSTVVNANKILVLNNGEIIERGDHNSLLTIRDGKYAQLWNEQIKGQEEETK